MAGEERGGRNARKVYQMDTGGGLENAGVYEVWLLNNETVRLEGALGSGGTNE